MIGYIIRVVLLILSITQIGWFFHNKEEPNHYGSTFFTYTKDIKPIFEKRCSSCHNSHTPQRNWLDYDTAYANRIKIKNRVFIELSMPPSGISMELEERWKISDWVDFGAKK